METEAVYARIEKIREWIESDHWTRAKADLRELVPKIQDNGLLLGTVSRLLMRVGATGAAIKSARRAARLAPRNGNVQEAAFDILWFVGMRSEGLERNGLEMAEKRSVPRAESSGVWGCRLLIRGDLSPHRAEPQTPRPSFRDGERLDSGPPGWRTFLLQSDSGPGA